MRFQILKSAEDQRRLKLQGPRDFKLAQDRPTVGKFGKSEIEQAAGKLVAFLQTRGAFWEPFLMGDLHFYYRQRGWDPEEAFFGLTGLWFDDSMESLQFEEAVDHVLCLGDKWVVTDLFVKACMRT